MSFFRRRQQPPTPAPDERVVAFWQWWHDSGRVAAQDTLSGGKDLDDLAGLAEHLAPFDGIHWHLAPGPESGHVLVLSGAGSPDARATARRLVLAAPPADTDLSYADFAPPHPDVDSVVVETDGLPVDLARVQVSARVNGPVFDVQVHHPVFADLSPESRTRATSELLTAALGELDAQLWLGEVQPLEFPPLDGFGVTALRSVVQDLKRKHLDSDGRPRWVMMRGESNQGQLLALVRSPLDPLTAPHLDTYVSVVLPYPAGEDGLPSESTAESLQRWQDRLEQQLGPAGQVVAHLSHGGTRTVHVYVDSTSGDLVATVRQLAKAWGLGSASVHEMHDPGWAAVTHLRS